MQISAKNIIEYNKFRSTFLLTCMHASLVLCILIVYRERDNMRNVAVIENIKIKNTNKKISSLFYAKCRMFHVSEYFIEVAIH